MPTYDYPRPAVSVDLVAFRVAGARLETLLMRRPAPPFEGAWTLPGGFVHEDEPLETTAVRVLSEKASLEDIYLEQLATFGAPDRDPRGRVISVAYFAVLDSDSGYDGDAKWFPADDAPPTGFDHDEILATALQRLRAKLGYSDIGFAFVPAEFTLTELQKTWEAVLGEPLDKRNFRKSVLARGCVEPTGRKSSGGAHPPAMIYRHVAS